MAFIRYFEESNWLLKKIASILLMGLLCFNWVGYKLLITYLQKKAESQLEVQIDKNDCDESQLLEIRVPLNLPYQNDQGEFTRHYGEIEIEGKAYTYVKRKIEDGVLILKCIRSAEKETLKKVDNRFFKGINGIDKEGNGRNSSPFLSFAKSIFSDFENNHFDFSLNVWDTIDNKWHVEKTSIFNSDFLSSLEHPPDHLASC
jgi:hypothetical protein